MTDSDRISRCRWILRPGFVMRSMASALAVVGLVGACASTEVPTPVKPELVWADGAPQGPLESDPWVQAVRDAEFAYAWAANTADFSSSGITETWSYFLIKSFASTVQGDLLWGKPQVYRGPRPLEPLAVEVSEDGQSAVVATCVDQHQTRPFVDDGNRWPNVVIRVVELDDHGHRRIVGNARPDEPFLLPDGAELTPEYCDGVTIPRALFDPAPSIEELAEKGRDDVILPSPAPSASS